MNRETLDIYGAIRKKNGPPTLELPGIETLDDLAKALYERFGKKRIVIRCFVDDTGPNEQARKYFHAVVVPACTQGFRALGWRIDNERCYEELKIRFCDYVPQGQRYSTANYSEERFKQFIDECCQFAAEDLGITIPPPAPIDAHFPTEQHGR